MRCSATMILLSLDCLLFLIESESLVSNKNTMQNIRDAIQKKSELGGDIRDSMVHTKIVLTTVFSQ